MMNYILHIVILIELYAMLALAMNLQLGFTGLMNLAVGAFFGVGAYIYALLAVKLGFGFIPAVLLAIIGNLFLSYVLAIISQRFKGDIFILVTIGFQIIIYTVLWNWVSVTNGPYGIAGIPSPVILGLTIDDLLAYSLFGLILFGIVALISLLIYRSPLGRTLQAIRDDALAAASIGKNIMFFKIKSIGVSGAFLAIAGAFYASYISYIDPTSFGLEESVNILFMVILGGLANFRGTIAGVITFVLLQEGLKFIGMPDHIAFNLRILFFSLAIILLLYFRPKGLLGKLKLE